MTKKHHKQKARNKPQKTRQIPGMVLNKRHFAVVENLVGFVVETVKSGEMAKVQTRGSLISDMPLFYTYIDQISGIFLKNIVVGQISQFLVLIHSDLSADVYLNNLPAKVLMMTKGSVEKGQVVTTNDIADIRRLSFDTITIKDTDKVICCFKVGWKFGLFFDLNRQEPLNIPAMEAELGALYRYLSFQYVYDVLESKPHFETLLRDGWFPFIEILASEFRELSEAYKNLPEPKEKIEQVLGRFQQERV